MTKFPLLLISGLLVSQISGARVVTPSLEQALEEQGSADITILFNEGVSKPYNQIRRLRFNSLPDKMTALRSALIANSKASQGPALKLIKSHTRRRKREQPSPAIDIHFQHHWISNTITIRNADAPLVQELSQVDGISEIREMIVIPLPPLTPENDLQQSPSGIQWGVQKVGGDTLWKNGITGKGIVVASIDSGVRGSHSILASNFLGEYGWFDPGRKTPFPIDSSGHGSHTMGTIAGGKGYGVAPGSKWMACKAAGPGGSLPEDYLLSCGQFIVCPTRSNGSDPDCSKAPHIVNNSWGSSTGGRSWFDGVIRAWQAAGIIPIFSAGNSGPNCGTVGSPGDRRGVISVAATDLHDYLATFSSRGPARGSSRSEHKPEIAAPGFNIKSAWHTSNDAFESVSGTSMASPHTTGAVALLLQVNPKLVRNYQGVRNALLKGADKKGWNYGQDCGGINKETFPNFGFGFGRLNATVSSTLNYI